ncbi:Hypothetical predicted protein [Podarcis lilfordi]|uniref:Uncharacterized protein n=1 Tax=Podarcis lilfordi TaxID=74358 RepID=A0AA35KXV0_9SAUR|nr:Hypothetical predicted protein [Podarcis lilfordi]
MTRGNKSLQRAAGQRYKGCFVFPGFAMGHPPHPTPPPFRLRTGGGVDSGAKDLQSSDLTNQPARSPCQQLGDPDPPESSCQDFPPTKSRSSRAAGSYLTDGELIAGPSAGREADGGRLSSLLSCALCR